MDNIHTVVPYGNSWRRVKSDCPDGWDEWNDDWYLSSGGDMRHAWTDYEIPHQRLDEDDWLLHLMYREWFDANTFLPAWLEACRRWGMKVAYVRTGY